MLALVFTVTFLTLLGLGMFLGGLMLVIDEFRLRTLRRRAGVRIPLDKATLFLGVIMMAISVLPFRAMVQALT